ncbi:MAG: M15 family metallopeptidase [Lachnospiraceae bacterium]|nr:M15 family metallopeptidase [Lachnospiraceae bacterium]
MDRPTLDERIRKSLIRFGKKNPFCYRLALPLLAAEVFVSRLVRHLKGSTAKLCMLGSGALFFAVFCSFSFPLFTGNQTALGIIDFGELDESVSLAAEEVSATEEELSALQSEVEGQGDAGVSESFRAEEILAELLAHNAELEQEASETTDEGTDRDPDAKPEEIDPASFSPDDWRLILINKQHFIPADYEFSLASIKGNLQCDERVLKDLQRMLEAAVADGIRLDIISPYRSDDHQEELFEKKIKLYMKSGMSYLEAYQEAAQAVTIPGASEHQVGLALDITCATYRQLNEGFADTKEGKWLAENCYKYGFILRYPKGKEYITTIEFEPWHFRYVGVEAATYMTLKDLTLEEFWEELF